ncbi:motility associated factor glycosyltransferase family protein [Campylobacter aviculae]|uniref:PseE protein n=1 Tax=Campylobacter aviculae TaxID=2510190 RepID=A0A4U7BEQ8_9BACT|nr:motility associated factor glycosyltransferase family protein [Campylobacter aviculae]TKX28295.1 PseE protein [Campylobacter aviculae]
MQNELFDKNIKAMDGREYKELKDELEKIKELREFAYTFGKDNLDINIIKKRNLKAIYKNPLKELEEKIEFFKDYDRYPALFFYGLGNGILYKALLQNKNHKRIIVFEKEIEIIFIVLNLLDLSEELRKGRLILIYTPHMTYTKADAIFSLGSIDRFFKTYTLFTHSNFYKSYKEDILKTNTLNSKAIKNISLRRGNDPKDAMQGIEQFVRNIPKMINHPSYHTLLKKRKNTKDENVAIIVSTGPSLGKQLPLLKKYANKATIFCADSAYPILAKHGIKPDYVCMMERDAVVAECFNNDFKEFDDGITFVVASLIHKNTIQYLESNKRSYILATRPLSFATSVKLHEFGYISCGMSVAHMNYELANRLNYKNIVLIGQDLAYGEKGESHTKNFLHEKLHDGHYKRDFDRYTTLAYGGKGEVQSSEIWNLFREIFENFIASNKNKIKTYNCTEGGARIEGAIEKPFKEICETLLTKDLHKPFPKIPKLSKEQRINLMLKSYKQIKKQMSLADTFLKECKKIKNQLADLKRGKLKITLEQLNQNLDKLKARLDLNRYGFLFEILGPTLHHEESIIAPLYVQSIKNESERQNKLFAWLYAHESLVESIFELVTIQNMTLKKAIIPLQDELEKRNLI